jgi:hypothetical protein
VAIPDSLLMNHISFGIEGSNPSLSAIMAAGKSTSPSKKRHFEDYKKNHVREKNKILKIQRHLKIHPNDQRSFEQITRLEAIIGK